MSDPYWSSPAVPDPAPTVVQGPVAPTVIETRRRGPGVLGTVLIAAVVAAIVGSFAGLTGYLIGQGVDGAADAPRTTTSAPSLDVPRLPSGTSPRADGSIAAIAASTLPAVVSILVEGDTEAGSGSGFIVRPDGYILTNNHVVAVAGDTGSLTVVFQDGSRAEGTLVGTNASYDVAVVKVDRADLPTLALGDSEAVKVGDVTIAIGAPLGLDGTVTSGIVSAVDRPVTAGETEDDVSFINAIQTDAAINPGNSGGPLLDGNGAVIGVNSAIATIAVGGEAGNIGLGFAIPINSAKRIAEEIIATGTSRTPLMGVQLDMEYTDPGARIRSITAGSGAERAGLEIGDVIVAVNGRSIDDATELVVEVRTYAPGDQIEVEYQRNGQSATTQLVLGDDAGGED